MNAIEINGLNKSYGSFHLENISFKLPKGTIMGLVGENGAGKSTTIKLIMNAIKADSGSVLVLGEPNTANSFKDIKQNIGVVLDESNFSESLNSYNINKIMKNTYNNWDEKLFFDYIEKFSIPLSKKFKDFSRGMKMKLAISAALSHKPRLLILDEPTGGLDPMVRDEILNAFSEFTRDENNSILISSHIISDLEKICDYITFLHEGKLVLCEEKDMLLENFAIAKLTEGEFETLPREAIEKSKKTSFGYEVLLKKKKTNPGIRTEFTTLEDIVVFMAREEK